MRNPAAKARLVAAGSARARRAVQIEDLERRALLAAAAVDFGLPTAALTAKTQSVWAPSYTFKVTYSSSSTINVGSIDSNDITVTGPNGYSKRAQLIGATSDDSGLNVTARYKIATPGALWDAADNGRYTLKIRSSQVKDLSGQSVTGGLLGRITFNIPQLPTETGTLSDVPPGAVDVRNFGAVPNDGRDDTVAIQRAIDSLPLNSGAPDGTVATGGVVFIPAGTWDVNRPLSVSSGITLKGQGAPTLLKSTTTDSSLPVIQLYSYWGHSYVIQAAIEDLSIQTNAAKGISANTGTVDQVVNLELRGLTISAAGPAIDLRGVDTYQTTLRDITINNPGSTAIWVEAGQGGNAAINRITNVVVTGTARRGFRAERALVSLGNDSNVDGLSIADIGTTVTPLYVTGGGTFSNLSLPTTGNLPGGVLVKIENAGYVSFDQLTNLGPSRFVQLKNSYDVQVASLHLDGGSTLEQGASVDATSHLSVGTLLGNGGTINRARVRLGPATTSAPGPVTQMPSKPGAAATESAAGPVSPLVVDVARFGARPNDGADDTAAIQAAIDSFSRGTGIPGGGGKAVGGTIFFSVGTYDTSAPIRVSSGVWLVGQRDGTLVRNSKSDSNSAAVLLVSGASIGTNAGAGISNLSIHTTNAAAIRADGASITSALVDLHLSNLTLSAGGPAIDLRAVRTYHANIDHVGITNPGSTALWIGDDAGYSANNRVTGVQVYGAARAGFRAERALFVFQGQNQIESLWLEGLQAHVLPLYVSGSADLRGVWLEPPVEYTPNRIAATFENTSSITIDRLFAIDELRRIRLRNSPNVNIGHVNIFGRDLRLDQALDLDATSHVNIGTVAALRDTGMLDNPQVDVHGTFNLLASSYLDTRTVLTGQNLLDDMHNWTLQWGDGGGQVQGSMSIEQTANGPRMRVEVTSNPNRRPVSIFADLNVDWASVGKSAAIHYRADGPGQVAVFNGGWTNMYSSRAMNSLTTAPVPTTLRQNEQMIIVLPSTTGVFYLSNFGIVVN